MTHTRSFDLADAVGAQKALRDLAGLGPELFPVQAFVGMISDEIEALRKLGHSDSDIAATIRANSRIDVTPDEITENYAPAEQRHQTHP